MIMRIWHGMTKAEDADRYADLVNRTGVKDYRATPGNRAVYLLRRIEGQRAHFLTVTLWDSYEAIRRFAGDDVNKAHYYPEDKEFLLEFEPTVTHYEVLVGPTP